MNTVQLKTTWYLFHTFFDLFTENTPQNTFTNLPSPLSSPIGSVCHVLHHLRNICCVFTLICLSCTHATHVSLSLSLCVRVCFAVCVGFRFVFYSKFGSTICSVVALRTFTIVILISTLHHSCCLCLIAG